MTGDDPMWHSFVEAMLAAGHAEERTSKYADKPALFVAGREIAHLEAPGIVDLRITSAGWARAKARFASDPVVHRDPSRRDWIELRLDAPADLARLNDLLVIALGANT